MTHRSDVLRLYRRILSLHRHTLEPRMRVLGDAYVRDEFQRHKAAAPEFVALFLQEWRQYAAQLGEREIGRHLSSSEKEMLNSEQEDKLRSLHEAAQLLGEAGSKRE